MEAWNILMKYLNESTIILIPCLLSLGAVLKTLNFIADRTIPLILTIFSIVLSVLILGFNPHAIIQGILSAGGAVLIHQIYKQSKSEKK